MAKRKAKVNVPMCLAGVLFCLTLFSFHLTGGLYAKYTTTGAGGDSARVITFGELTLTEKGIFTTKDENDVSFNEFIVTPGVDIEKQAVVSFSGSEAATYVFVEVVPTGWTPSENNTFTYSFKSGNTLSWSIADGWTYVKNTSNPYVYYMELAPNTVLPSLTDDITTVNGITDQYVTVIDGGKITVSEEITENDLSNMRDLSIQFKASAVQSGGFESAEAAWKSLSGKGA